MSGALAIAALAPAQAPAATGGWRLPDLEQEPPSALVLSNGALNGHPGTYYLGFRSAVRNVGLGPLLIHGQRTDRRTPTMAATQLVDGAGGAVRRVHGVGRMRYVVSPGHRHWHLLGFDRYTLRRVGGPRIERRDRKTGFCLGDRFRALPPFAGPSPAEPTFTSNCGLLQPGRLSVDEALMVGLLAIQLIYPTAFIQLASTFIFLVVALDLFVDRRHAVRSLFGTLFGRRARTCIAT